MSYAGRVEVFAHGVWGRVFSSWSSQGGLNEFAVVRRQLSFPGVITALRYLSFGGGSGPVLMSNVQCTGSEKTIQQCQYKDWIESDMVNGREVGVICKSHDFDPGEVFNNTALNSDAVINLEEDVSHSSEVHLGTSTTDTSEQTRQDPGPVYEEAGRPLPPIPVAHNTAREEDTRSSEMQSKSAAERANVTFNNVASVTRAGNEFMRISPKNGHSAAPAVLAGAGRTYYNSCTFLAPEQAGDSSYYSINSTQAQTSGIQQQGNNRKRNKRVAYFTKMLESDGHSCESRQAIKGKILLC